MEAATADLSRVRLALRARSLGLYGADRPSTFSDYVQRHNPSLLDFAHVPRLVDVGQRVLDGDLPRVIVLLPPRYFKTETFSRLLTGHALRQAPEWNVGLASYGAELAWSISEEARHYYQQDGGNLDADTRAKKRWRTRAGGEMWAAGVGGPMLGFGYHLGIVDDPQDPEKAHSPTYQRRWENWWPQKFLSRQEPDARIVVIMQRLGMQDAIDYLFRREVGEDTPAAPEHWHVVVCDEVKSNASLWRGEGPQGLPETCTLEPDPRDVGDVLAPSRFDGAAVAKLQTSAGPYTRSAQRQQRPSAPSGDFWGGDWFDTYEALPDDAHNGGKDWDTAYTKDEANSASAFVESYIDRDGVIYIEDCGWEWSEFPELVLWMQSLTGPHYVEQKASGKSVVQALLRQDIMAEEVEVAGDKFARASAAQPVVANRKVRVKRAVRRKLLEGDRQGLLRVTAEALVAGRGDLDLNDAFVQAINRHAGGVQFDSWEEGFQF